LGNQLFKFANGLRVAEYFEEKLILDISWYRHNYMKSNDVSNREFELAYFPAVAKIEKHVSKIPRIDEFRGKCERRLIPNIQTKIGMMTELNFNRFESPPKFIDGSFERTIFLPKVETIRNFLSFPHESTKWFEEGVANNSSRFVVAIHVRRTDYLNLTHIYDVIDKAYYVRAVDLLRQANEKISLHLFSDDPDGAIRWLGDSITIDKVISQPKNTPSGEVLRLISTYDAIIAANSTFSWWAAYLGRMKNKDLQIVLPKKYSNLNEDSPKEYLNIDGAVFL
jgi:O86/O127-antigen biosynthesis alpha-1,2-fucosyltransferase